MTTVSDAIEKLGLKVHNLADPERQITSVYAGDLLSWVMGHANESEALVTIMSNINVLAVASLLDLSCVVLCENVAPDSDFVKVAKDKKINIFSTGHTAYEVCVGFSELLKK